MRRSAGDEDYCSKKDDRSDDRRMVSSAVQTREEMSWP
jgi:hypothetical protein